MTNKEKAKEIKDNNTAVLATGKALNDLLYDSAMEMAKWKDTEFKETLKTVYKTINKFHFECKCDKGELIYLIKEAIRNEK